MTIDVNRHKLFARFRNSILATVLVSTLAACGSGAGSKGTAEAALPDDPTTEQVVDTSTSSTTTTPMTDTSATSTSDRAAILAKYNYLDPNRIVPTQALADAVVYWDANKAKIKNVNYLSIINFAQNSREKRFYIIDMNSGGVWAIHVAHGKGSDPDYDGYATKFSNSSGSNMSSLGYYMTAETYSGEHGLSLRLDGLSSTNSNARARAIVIHQADYVQESNVIAGRSWGCPAIANENRDKVIAALKNGSLIYAVVDKGGTSRDWSGSAPPQQTPTPTPTPSPTPTTPSQGAYEMVPLSWESSSHPERVQWSEYLQNDILTNWSSLLKGASDITSFCPKYNNLNNNQKANVWAQLFVAITKYESAYSPTSRMRETTMGTDPVTKQPVYSEGLLQLSYQDTLNYKFCSKIDWSKDKNLAATDPKKTILDPYINLDCGVGIMANQVSRKGMIAVSSGAYWSTIIPGGRYTQLSNIKSMVSNLSLCK